MMMWTPVLITRITTIAFPMSPPQIRRRLPVSRPEFLSFVQNHRHSTHSHDRTSTRVASTTTTTTDGGIIQERRILLPNGVSMQVICGIPHSWIQSTSTPSAPNVFLLLHGSFHSAWCYQEHYIPYFLSLQQNDDNPFRSDTIILAPSWRGTAGTIITNIDDPPPKKVQMEEHVNDLHLLIQYIPTILQNVKSNNDSQIAAITKLSLFSSSPLRLYVVCHSFGGIVLMKYLEKYYNRDGMNVPPIAATTLAGIIPMCSIPPSGNGQMTLRFLRRSLLQSYRITRGFAMKQCCRDIELCRTLFFDETVDDRTIQRYQSYFQRDSTITIDLLDLAQQLPSKCTHAQNGTATFITENSDFPPCCIIGARRDYIVDTDAVLETARYFNCVDHNENDGNASPIPRVTWIDSAHDVMLGGTWKNGATTIVQWIQEQERILMMKERVRMNPSNKQKD